MRASTSWADFLGGCSSHCGAPPQLACVAIGMAAGVQNPTVSLGAKGDTGREKKRERAWGVLGLLCPNSNVADPYTPTLYLSPPSSKSVKIVLEF